jgi:hypothetical protein
MTDTRERRIPLSLFFIAVGIFLFGPGTGLLLCGH